MRIRNKDGTEREKITVNLDPEVYERLRKFSIENVGSVTMQSRVVNDILRDYFDFVDEEKQDDVGNLEPESS